MVFSLVLRLLDISVIGKRWYFYSFLIIWYCILVSKVPWSNCSSFWSLIAFINSVWNLLLPGALSSFIQIFPHNYFHNLQKNLQNISSQEALLVSLLTNKEKKSHWVFMLHSKLLLIRRNVFFFSIQIPCTTVGCEIEIVCVLLGSCCFELQNHFSNTFLGKSIIYEIV